MQLQHRDSWPFVTTWSFDLKLSPSHLLPTPAQSLGTFGFIDCSDRFLQLWVRPPISTTSTDVTMIVGVWWMLSPPLSTCG